MSRNCTFCANAETGSNATSRKENVRILFMETVVVFIGKHPPTVSLDDRLWPSVRHASSSGIPLLRIPVLNPQGHSLPLVYIGCARCSSAAPMRAHELPAGRCRRADGAPDT